MFKRILSTMLAIMLLSGIASLTFAEGEKTPEIEKWALPAVSLGELYNTNYNGISMATGVVNGHNYFYTATRGAPDSIFNVYDLDARKPVAFHELRGMSGWELEEDSKGNIWMTGFGKLAKYDPYADKLTNFGSVLPGESASFAICVDDKDNVYVGTYPNGHIVKYDQSKKTFEDIWAVSDGSGGTRYVRNLDYLNGYIYCGTYSSDGAKFVRINRDNPSDMKVIKLENSYVKPEQVDWVYYVTCAGDLVFLTLEIKNANPNRPEGFMIYDTKTEKFLDFEYKDVAGYASQPYENKCYFVRQSDTPNEFHLYSIDLETREISDTGINPQIKNGGFGVINRGSKVIQLKDNPQYPNPVLITAHSMDPTFFDFKTKETTKIPLTDKEKRGSSAGFTNVYSAENGDIWIAPSAAGNTITIKNVLTGKDRYISTPAQAEGLQQVGDYMYVGGYPAGWIYRIDIKTGKSEKLGRTGEDQGRPHTMAYDGKSKVFFGCCPEYGCLSGAFGWYDSDTGKIESFIPVPDQTVSCIAYKDGFIYGTTSIYGGAGSSPTQQEAKVFIFDVENKKLVKSFVPKVPGQVNANIRGITFDNNGQLWVNAGYNLFVLDPKTEEISHLFNFGTDISKINSPTQLIVKDNLIYANIAGIRVIDTVNYTCKDLSNYTKNPAELVLGEDGNLYFTNQFYKPYCNLSMFNMVPIVDFEVNYEDLMWAKKLFWETDNLGLYIGNPLSYANKKIKYIDSQNENVIPVVENGRTLVPVRFIAESFGAEVLWNDETQTATLKKDNLTVKIPIGKTEIFINDKQVTLDVPAKTVDGRTLLPLRAIADTFGKQVFWDDCGIIIISANKIELTKEQISFVDLYLKYYLKEDYLEDAKIAKNQIGAKKVKITNWDFEDQSRFSTDPAVGWTVIGEVNNSNTAIVTDEVAYTGSKSLKIFERAKQELGFKSDLIPVSPTKQYILNYRMMVPYGRIYFGVEFYDKNEALITKTESVNLVTAGRWSLIDTDIPVSSYANAAYVRLVFKKPYDFEGEGYIDSVELYEYTL